MNELVDFLRARLDEDERAARAADVKEGDPEWWVSEVKGTGGQHFTVRSREEMRPIARVERLDGDDDEPSGILDGEAAANHIARHDPARVLCEVEAKRTLLGYCERALSHQDPLSRDQAGEVAMAAITITYLAVAYADHAEYRKEWKP